ncbi:MAG: 2-succinyl-5-enolpyruvyl-6-hydroxy-3-cyclohexene-1-carboxylic-acid synthase, partial [Acidimicrobiales bacterium]
TGMPSVLICTSGTAAANYLPAIIEASHSATPVIVCTADRPPELRQWGAGQTIDQVHLYGTNVRWFQEVPVAGETPAAYAGVLALRAGATALHEAGPVHLNWPFREPLAPPGPLAPPASVLASLRAVPAAPGSRTLESLAESHERGIIVAGPDTFPPSVRREICSFARGWGWPIVADPASGFRSFSDTADAPVLTTSELLFASAAFRRALPPCDVVVRIGSSPTAKAYRLWLESSPPGRLVLVAPGVEWADPSATVTDVVPGPLEGLFAGTPTTARESEWVMNWRRAEAVAADVVDHFLVGDDSELKLARQVVDELVASGEPATLVVSNSMPIRDLDAVMGRSEAPVRVIANRGANGIDGVVATAAGVAQASGQRTVLLIGDVATLHDLGGLAAVARLRLNQLTVVVIDNDGGGIFSFLPVAGAIKPEVFEELFATPHGTDLAAVGAALGMSVQIVGPTDNLTGKLVSGDRPTLVLHRNGASVTTTSMAKLRRQVDEAFQGDW